MAMVVVPIEDILMMFKPCRHSIIVGTRRWNCREKRERERERERERQRETERDR
jgi:hypothetical protein